MISYTCISEEYFCEIEKNCVLLCIACLYNKVCTILLCNYFVIYRFYIPLVLFFFHRQEDDTCFRWEYLSMCR